AYQQAQHKMGNFAAKTVSVGELFSGALLPGLMLVGIYILYQLFIGYIRPELCPALPREAAAVDERDGDGRLGAKDVVKVLFPPLAMIVAVLGSILGGVATATEGAAEGAVGATSLRECAAGATAGQPGWPSAVWRCCSFWRRATICVSDVPMPAPLTRTC